MRKLILVSLASMCAFVVIISVSTDCYAKELASGKGEKTFKIATNSPDTARLIQAITNVFSLEEDEKAVFLKAGLGKSPRYKLFYGIKLSF